MNTLAVVGGTVAAVWWVGLLATMWCMFLTDKTGRIQNPLPYSRPFYIWIPAALLVLTTGLLNIY